MRRRSGSTRLGDAPAELRERHAAARVDDHTFAHESNALRGSRASAVALETEPPLRVDHAMPGHRRSVRQRREGVAHLTRMAGKSGDAGDATVCRDTSSRNTADDRI